MLYKLSPLFIEELRQVKAKDQLCFMAALLQVEERDLETILKKGVVTERWLRWRFVCDAVVAVYASDGQGKRRWKEHKVEYFKRE